MYNIAKAPTKQVIEKTRKGFSQKLDSQRELQKKTADTEDSVEMSSPKPVFHQVNGNKRSLSQRSPQETISLQHEEIIKFIHDGWTRVDRELQLKKPSTFDTKAPSVQYHAEAPHPDLKDFKPFDLESWWGQRLYQNLTQLS